MIPTPFTNMAVSLSGGGYRATTFHLGALSFLDSIKIKDESSLLENVKIISTISGGTLTGVMYALKLAEGGTFIDCFHKLYELLEEDKLVEQALGKLNHPSRWKNKYKSRDVINAFSEVYNQDFYGEATFDKLYKAENIHLTDIIFGSTEFSYGIQFRFQEDHGQGEDGKFGNGYLDLPPEAAKEIRLADAAASSSCFPGGFEPMIMPKDYANGPDSIVSKTWYERKNEQGKYPTTAIMDGGVIDNQGIEGVKLAEQRHSNEGEPFIGTYIVSDVSGQMMERYEVPTLEHSTFKDFFTLQSINVIASIITILIISLFIFIPLPTWGIITASCVLTVMALWFLLFLMTRSFLVKKISTTFAGNELPRILKDFRVILKTPIYILLYLFEFRATSVLKMVMDIFLRRIRRLQLNSLYESPDWNYRFWANNIYSLKEEKNFEELPKKMKKAIENANKMPTTLWFSEAEKANGMLDDLIACGQFTLCSNLSNYIQYIKEKKKIWDQIPTDKQRAIEEILSSIEEAWKKFEEDPYWLLYQYKNKRA